MVQLITIVLFADVESHHSEKITKDPVASDVVEQSPEINGIPGNLGKLLFHVINLHIKNVSFNYSYIIN